MPNSILRDDPRRGAARLSWLSAILPALLVAQAHGGILEDVPFDDVAGTEIQDAVNVATGHPFDVDADLAGVTTNGAGQLNASLKSNLEFGTTYIDSDDIASGPVYGVMELSFAFDTATLDPAENEEIRISLIQFDPRSTFVTAEWEIQREDDGSVTIFGNAVGTGSVDTGSATLNPTETDLIAVVAVNLDSSLMSIHYSQDGGASFSTLAGGVLDPTRGVGSLRMTLNNDLSQDSVLINRVYMTDMNPYPGLIPELPGIPEPSTFALAGVGLAFAAARRWRRRAA